MAQPRPDEQVLEPVTEMPAESVRPTNRLPVLLVSVQLLLALAFSGLVLFSQIEQLFVYASIVLFAAIFPTVTTACFLAAIPIFGNKPQTVQFYALLGVASSVLVGLMIARLRWQRTQPSYSMLVLSLYGVGTIVSLLALPWSALVGTATSQLPDFQFSTLQLAIAKLFSVSEMQPSYSILSAGITIQAIAIAALVYEQTATRSRILTVYSWSILVGLTASMVFGLLDYYAVFSLAPIRALDPWVNPLGYQFRMQSFFGHSGWFAEYVTLAIPFSVILLTLPVRYGLRVTLLLLVLVLAEFVLILTFQRGAWISYPLTLLVLWCAVYCYRRIEREPSSVWSITDSLRASAVKIAISLPLTILATMLILKAVSGASFSDRLSLYQARFKDIARTSDRTEFFIAGFKLGMLNPFAGSGAESFGYWFGEEVNSPQGAFYRQHNLPLHGSAHNVYMQTFAGRGLLGLYLLLLVIVRTALDSASLAVARGSSSVTRILSVIGICFSAAFLIYGNDQEIFYIHTLEYLVLVSLMLFPSSRILRSSSSLLPIVALLVIAHVVWVYTTAEESVRYGCYGVEQDAEGKRFRWCASRAQQFFPVKGVGDHTRVELTLKGGFNQGQSILIELDGEVLEEVRLQGLERRALSLVLPQRDYGSTVPLRFVSGQYSIPSRDILPSTDSRVLSFMLFE